MFVDKVTIKVIAGAGGDGKVSFRHVVNQRTGGGPDGGDGGRGGNVVVRADHNTSSLYKYRTNKIWKAEVGVAGGKNRRHGRNGADLELIVPPGTAVIEEGREVADLVADQQNQVVAHGGQGGFGNAHFTSSTRQAPRFAELGEPGEEKELTFELKMIAEVGLVGLPNAGKSTLLSVVSNARPEIADYAFTTLVPNLGVVEVDGQSILFADIPGLIEGASEGKGLGDEFLRHVERTRVIIHLIDAASADIGADYQTIRQELAHYSQNLAKKPQLVALSKTDTVPAGQVTRQLRLLEKLGLKPNQNLFTISAQAHRGVDELLRAVVKLLQVKPKSSRSTTQLPVIRLTDTAGTWQVTKTTEGFVVTGTELERRSVRTNFDQPDAVARLRRVLIRRGVGREIERQGGGAGSVVRIAGKRLVW